MCNTFAEEELHHRSRAGWIARIDQLEQQRPRARVLRAIAARCLLICGLRFLRLGFESLNDALRELTTTPTPGSATFVTQALQRYRQTFGFG